MKKKISSSSYGSSYDSIHDGNDICSSTGR